MISQISAFNQLESLEMKRFRLQINLREEENNVDEVRMICLKEISL